MAYKTQDSGGKPAGMSDDTWAALQGMIGQLQAQGGGSDEGSKPVYMGTTTIYPDRSGLAYREPKRGYKPPPLAGYREPKAGYVPPKGAGPKKRDEILTRDQALAQYFQWTPKTRNDFVQKAILAGLAPVGAGIMEGSKVWANLVDEAAMFYAAGNKTTPMDIFSAYVAQAGGAGENAWKSQGVWEVNTVTGERRYAGPGIYLGGGRAKEQRTSIDLTDPTTARAIATKLFQDLMGRDPGKGELTRFASALQEAEQANPVTETTITEYNMETGQPISSSSSRSGGLTDAARGQIGEDQIKADPEHGAFQAATTYMGAMENVVWNAPELGGGE